MARIKAPKINAGETTQRLLDAAEQLFGECGYDGVGMRELADKAQVNLGAATYHYGSKKALYIETFVRRFRPSSKAQLQLLRQAESRQQPVPVDCIVECIVTPIFSLGVAYPNFGALLARNLIAPPKFLHTALRRDFERIMRAYSGALRLSMPHIPQEIVRGRLRFAMGSLLMFSAQIARVSPTNRTLSLKVVFNDLARFLSAGMQATTAAPNRDVIQALSHGIKRR